jgi:hypothetical protein
VDAASTTEFRLNGVNHKKVTLIGSVLRRARRSRPTSSSGARRVMAGMTLRHDFRAMRSRAKSAKLWACTGSKH